MTLRQRNRGTVLIVAMILCFAMAGTVIVLCRSMRVETMAAANSAAVVQASAVERGAEQYVLAVISDQSQPIQSISEEQFASVQIGDGYFWILRPNYSDSTYPVFGLVDENSKLNINTASSDQLMLLPLMTQDVAGAIVDWRDGNDDVSPSGAESSYYESLPDGYDAKNDSYETVEELLLVRGITRDLLYGSGQSQPLGTQVTGFTNGVSGADPQLATGLYDLLTVYSAEPNTAPDGSQKVNIADRTQRTQLQKMLNKQLSKARSSQIMSALGRSRTADIFDFANKVKLSPDEIDAIADYITVNGGGKLKGRINVNTASTQVLQTLPSLTTDDIQKLIAARPTYTDGSNSISWVATALGPKAAGLGTTVTARSYQYSADILAVSGNGRAFKRVRIVVDNRTGTPKIVYRRDVTERGWPMDDQILASLRAGQGLGTSALAAGAISGAMSR